MTGSLWYESWLIKKWVLRVGRKAFYFSTRKEAVDWSILMGIHITLGMAGDGVAGVIS